MEIIYYEKAEKNKTVGYVDLRIPIVRPAVLILRKLPHLGSGNKRWFNLASFNRPKSDGSNNYLKYAEFENQMANSYLLENMSEKVKVYCEKHGIREMEEINFDEFPKASEELPF